MKKIIVLYLFILTTFSCMPKFSKKSDNSLLIIDAEVFNKMLKNDSKFVEVKDIILDRKLPTIILPHSEFYAMEYQEEIKIFDNLDIFPNVKYLNLSSYFLLGLPNSIAELKRLEYLEILVDKRFNIEGEIKKLQHLKKLEIFKIDGIEISEDEKEKIGILKPMFKITFPQSNFTYCPPRSQ